MPASTVAIRYSVLTVAAPWAWMPPVVVLCGYSDTMTLYHCSALAGESYWPSCLVTQPHRKACLGFCLGDVISTCLAHSHDATVRCLPMMIGRVLDFCFFVLKRGGGGGFLLSEELDSITVNRLSEALLFPPGPSRSQMILAKCVCSPSLCATRPDNTPQNVYSSIRSWREWGGRGGGGAKVRDPCNVTAYSWRTGNPFLRMSKGGGGGVAWL